MHAGLLRLVAIGAISWLVVACSPSAEPRGAVTEPVDLFWYARRGSDDYVRIPGFRTMKDCAQAGQSMTRLITEERESACDIAASFAGAAEAADDSVGCKEIVEIRAPWFECGTRCRPWDADPKIARCKTTEEHR
jgi:hypothetical protein